MDQTELRPAPCAGADLELVHAYEDVQRLNRELPALAEINRAINRHLNRDDLFGALATSLKTLVPTERFGIELPTDGNQLQGHILSQLPVAGEPTKLTILPAAGAACDWVIQHQEWYVASSCEEFRTRFPVTFDVMSTQGMESLLTLPLVSGGRSRGALFFMTSAKDAYAHLSRTFLEQVADAVAVALDNCLAQEELQHQASQALAESEERFRDLFDEAPIAYVHERLDSKFIRANRTAMKSLGITPDQVEGTYGRTFIPDTPDAQRRLKEAFESIGRGTDTSGVVLELRRKDNGKPLWIQWWSRPDPSGTYTRTMFVDITDRVLLEQEQARLQAQNEYLWEEIRREHNFGDIIGESPGLQKVMQQIQLVAPTDAAVLITGESGAGKELVARAIYDQSLRKGQAFIKINCSAIPEGLFESEFFGHVRGAFTGALKDKPGRFELADGGTLFLDEIGEVPLSMQSKLLRVLQEQELERVGDSRTRKVNVRIIAATNHNLKKDVEAGRFHQDLFYRLSVFPIEILPLRERREDIPPLVAHFVNKYAQRLNRPEPRLTRATMIQLSSYEWPGNVRELHNAVERAAILSQGGPLRFDLGESKASDAFRAPTHMPSKPTLLTRDEMKRQERDSIVYALKQTGGKLSGPDGAAELLGMKLTTLASRIKALGITRKPGAE